MVLLHSRPVRSRRPPPVLELTWCSEFWTPTTLPGVRFFALLSLEYDSTQSERAVTAGNYGLPTAPESGLSRLFAMVLPSAS